MAHENKDVLIEFFLDVISKCEIASEDGSVHELKVKVRRIQVRSVPLRVERFLLESA